jgi:hypothetical protein
MPMLHNITSGEFPFKGVNSDTHLVVSQFELLIATFPAPHNLSSDVMPMIRRF